MGLNVPGHSGKLPQTGPVSLTHTLTLIDTHKCTHTLRQATCGTLGQVFPVCGGGGGGGGDVISTESYDIISSQLH